MDPQSTNIGGDSKSKESPEPYSSRLDGLSALRSDLVRIDRDLTSFRDQEMDVERRWYEAEQAGETDMSSFREESVRLTDRVDDFYRAHKAVLFGVEGQYVGGSATFRAEVGRDYWDGNKNPTGFRVLKEAIATYARNFRYFDRHDPRPEDVKQTVEEELQRVVERGGNGEQPGGWWRYSIDSFGQYDFDSDTAPGMEIIYFYNCSCRRPGEHIEEGRKVDGLTINNLKSQLRFRTMMTDVEIKLLEENIPYELGESLE